MKMFVIYIHLYLEIEKNMTLFLAVIKLYAAKKLKTEIVLSYTI